MNKLVKLELRNLFKQKSLLICLIVSTALVIIGILASSYLNEMAPDGAQEGVQSSVNAFNSIIGFLCGGRISLLFAIIVSIYFGSEASDGTIKNLIAKGYSRSKFFIAKVICAIIATIIFIITAILSNYLMCLIVGIHIDPLSLSQLTKLGCVSLAMISEVIMFCSLSFIIFKTGANIVANVCIPMIFPLILTLIDVLLKAKIKISHFWIENTVYLITNNSKLSFITMVSLCYIVVFILLGIIITKRKEIK